MGWEDTLALQLQLLDALKRRKMMEGLGLVDNLDYTPEMLHNMFRSVEFSLRLAEPVYVTDQVADLWAGAQEHFAPESLQPSDLFVQAGFVLLPRPMALRPNWTPIEAFSWTSVDEGGVAVFGFARMDPSRGLSVRGREYTGEEAATFRAQFSPWVIAMILKLTFDETDPGPEVRAVQAFWRLGQEFVLTQERLSRLRRREVARLTKDGAPKEHVTVMRLRRVTDRLGGSTEPHLVDWSCQWIVRGHWRNQWYPSEGRHKQRYVPPYVKGPPDKPLRVTERVVEFVR